jgi:DNA-binding protein H-NS
MAGSDEDRGRSRRPGKEDQVWSGTGRVPGVTPHVTESLIKSLKLQLSLKARANQVIEV